MADPYMLYRIKLSTDRELEVERVGPYDVVNTTTNRRTRPRTVRNTARQDFLKGRTVDYRRFALLPGQSYADSLGRQYKLYEGDPTDEAYVYRRDWPSTHHHDQTVTLIVRIPKGNTRALRKNALEQSDEVVEAANFPETGEIVQLWVDGAGGSEGTAPMQLKQFKIASITHKGSSAVATAEGRFLN